jgi:prefoldin alpha subunit
MNQEFSQIMQEVQQTREHLKRLEQHREELTKLNTNLESLKNSEGGETLIPLGAGMFFRGKSEKISEVVMNVGSGVYVDQDIDYAMNTIKKQMDELTKLISQIQINLNYLNQKSQGMHACGDSCGCGH